MPGWIDERLSPGWVVACERQSKEPAVKTARWSITVCIAVLAAGGAVWLARSRVRMLDAARVADVTSGTAASGGGSRGAALAKFDALLPVLNAAVDELVRAGVCTLEQGTRFEQATGERVRFTLDPSLEAWSRMASVWGAAVPKHPVLDGQDITREEFDGATTMLRDAEYEWSKAAVRALVVDGKAQEIPERTGSFGNALFRATYPRPSDAERGRVTVLETIVPARLRQANGEIRQVKVGFSHWWQRREGGGRWVPWDVTVYFPPGPLSVKGHVL